MKDGCTINVRQGGTSEKLRDSNLELYRIIVMLLIIAHHYVVNSGLMAVDGPVYTNLFSAKSIFLMLFGAWGKTGINCFVAITGYYMCKSRITVKKFAKLLLEVMFYRIVIELIFVAAGQSELTVKGFLKLLIPITSIGSGFTSAYLVFFLCIPFLNILIQNMNRKQHALLILLCSFTYIFLGTMPLCSVKMNYVSWFIVLYIIMSFVRLYPCKIFEETKLWGISTLVFVVVSAVSVLASAWLGENTGIDVSPYSFVSDSNTFLAVATGISSFLFFKNLKMKNSKAINTIAASTFGVLLIHTSSEVMRNWLWKDLLNSVGVYDKAWMPLHAIGSVLAIYAVCMCIDYLRIRFIEKPIFRWWDKHWERISGQCNKIMQKLVEKLPL